MRTYVRITYILFLETRIIKSRKKHCCRCNECYISKCDPKNVVKECERKKNYKVNAVIVNKCIKTGMKKSTHTHTCLCQRWCGRDCRTTIYHCGNIVMCVYVFCFGEKRFSLLFVEIIFQATLSHRSDITFQYSFFSFRFLLGSRDKYHFTLKKFKSFV